MTMLTRKARRQVYQGRGECILRDPVPADPDPIAKPVPTIADTIPATWIMSSDVVCARDDLDVDALVELMVRRQIGCVPVVDSTGAPIGMVTKQDLVEQLLGSRRADAPPALVVNQVMMPLAFTLDEHATIAHAAAMMSIERVHHVPIVSADGSVIGVVSSLDIVQWLAANDGLFRAASRA